MGIQVQCPNGHVFKVKDKYAGKKGLCPKCEGQVVVHVPSMEDLADEILKSAALSSEQHTPSRTSAGESSASVLDDTPATQDSSTSASLLGSSVIAHKTQCECGVKVPMWYAKCPSCGRYLEH